MNLSFNLKIIGFVFIIFLLGCLRAPDLLTPEKIGEKERVGEITGKQATRVVNKMHGRSVATDANVIAEYGRDQKDLLFISKSKEKELSKIHSLTKDKPILTISDANGFAEHGVHINLYLAENKIRFEINETAVRESNFSVSYRLLKEAKIVKPGSNS